jgi:hypothetical protein
MRYYLLPLILTFLSLTVTAPAYSASNALATGPGYSLLRQLLVDEHYLTTIRRVKRILNFGGINERSAELVDQISSSSDNALQQLDSLATELPAIEFDSLDKPNIAITTFDALRYDMARKFIFDGERFEKDVLLSQVQVLPVIAHLTKQLEANEVNIRRKKWLHELALHYDDFYKRSQTFFVLANANN